MEEPFSDSFENLQVDEGGRPVLLGSGSEIHFEKESSHNPLNSGDEELELSQNVLDPEVSSVGSTETHEQTTSKLGTQEGNEASNNGKELEQNDIPHVRRKSVDAIAPRQQVVEEEEEEDSRSKDQEGSQDDERYTISQKLKSSLSKEQRIFTVEELERRRYFRHEFNIDEDAWEYICRIVDNLRSENGSDKLAGCKDLRTLLERTDVLNPLIDTVIVRCIIEVLHLVEDPMEEVAKVAKECLGNIQGILDAKHMTVEGVVQDEEKRRYNITQGWDGYMDHLEYADFLQEEEETIERFRKHKRQIVVTLLVVLGLSLVGTAFLIVSALIARFFSPTLWKFCVPLQYITISVLAWNAMVIPLTSLLLNFTSYEAPNEKSKFEAIENRQSLRVMWIVFLSLLLLSRYYTENGIDDQGFCVELELERASVNLIVYTIVLLLIGTLLISWLPNRRAVAEPFCFTRVYVPSASRYVSYGFLSFKFCKPLFRDVDAVKPYLDSFPERVSVQAALVEAGQRRAESGDFQGETHQAAPTGWLARRRALHLDAAVREYLFLQKILRSKNKRS